MKTTTFQVATHVSDGLSTGEWIRYLQRIRPDSGRLEQCLLIPPKGDSRLV